MRTLTPTIKSMLEKQVYFFRQCWKIECRDGDIFGFTNHTRPLTVEDLKYEPLMGLRSTAIKYQEGLSVDNQEITSFLTAQNERELIAGKFDFAKITLFEVAAFDPSAGSILLSKGFLGEVTRQDIIFTAEFRGLRQKLDTKVGRIITPECDALLGDFRCKVNLADILIEDLTVTIVGSNESIHRVSPSISFIGEGLQAGMDILITGCEINDANIFTRITAITDTSLTTSATLSDEEEVTVTISTQFDKVFTGTINNINTTAKRRIFGDTDLRFASGDIIPDNWFLDGYLRFETGLNAGARRDIRSSAGGTFTTLLEFPYDVEEGDTFTVVTGCDKRFSTCKNKFDNHKNFRGFPHVPTIEDILDVPIVL